jgi:DNA polymerase-3 subunit epsilon
MRQIILDTETTGLSWERGNRVVEIGCVEFVERRPTGRTFQRYLNPEREFEPGAQQVTGLSLDFLSDKPKFAAVVDEFLEFVLSKEGQEIVVKDGYMPLTKKLVDEELAKLK